MRVTPIAFVALVAALVLGWPVLVPPAIAIVGGLYGVELAIDDAPLDPAAPAVAVGLAPERRARLLVARRKRNRTAGDRGQTSVGPPRCGGRSARSSS